MSKRRIPIPQTTAAEVLFAADRTCCVCRDAARPVQIHHIDSDPANNAVANLAVLCLPCHDATQIKGGFGRKLDSYQITLYRDDWSSKVLHFRMVGPGPTQSQDTSPDLDIRLATTLPEIFKKEGDSHSLISFYHDVGDYELRDKYIDEVLDSDPEPWVITWVARLQGKSSEVPSEIFERAIADSGNDFMVKAQLLSEAGRPLEAAKVMVTGILEGLNEGRLFNAAYNMNHLAGSPFVEELFKIELEENRANQDIWWQFRCYEELGWESEARNLLTSNAERIRSGKSLPLRRALAKVTADAEELFRVEKEIAHAGISAFFDLSEEDIIGNGSEE